MSNETTRERFTRGELAAIVGVTNWGDSGGEWLQSVASDWVDCQRVEAVTYGEDISDAIHAAADGAVPIYTAERWAVFTDLAAWQFSEEIAEEWGDAFPTEMTNAAGLILFCIARDLLYFLEASLVDGAE